MKAVEKVRPAVVNIFTERIVTQEVRDPFDIYMERFFGGGMSRGRWPGFSRWPRSRSSMRMAPGSRQSRKTTSSLGRCGLPRS